MSNLRHIRCNPSILLRSNTGTQARISAAIREYTQQMTSKPTTSNDPTKKKESILVEIQRLPFPRFPMTNSGIADIIPRTKTLTNALEVGKFQIKPNSLTALANKFVQINTNRKEPSEDLEHWRVKVLEAFEGDLKEITRAASLFAKISPNKSLSYALYKVAAEEGYQNAAHNYAVILGTRSLDVANGRAIGAKIIKDLAKFGHPPSQLMYADMLLNRKGSGDDVKNALQLIESAASSNFPSASYMLASIYRDGKVVPHDYQRAVSLFSDASKSGSPEGYFMVGVMHSNGQGTKDGKPDYTMALDYFTKAAAGGSVEAQFNVGLYYMEGKGTPKNIDLAVEYWSMAAAGRFPVAMLNLGKLYYEGDVISKSYKRARNLLEAAAECTDSDGFIKSEAQSLLDKIEAEDKARCIVM